jgi:prepilin signal peptidase PulO-like enzyme (type II secretory pathway)
MSAFEDVQQTPKSMCPFGEHGHAALIFAALGCLLTFRIFEFELALLVSAWWCLSVIIIRCDLEHFIIPNWATAGIAALALVYTVTSPGAFSRAAKIMDTLAAPLEGAALVFVGVAVFGWASARIAKRECLGFGDVKLCGALALWLNAYDLLVTLEVACLAALGLVAVSYLRSKRTFNDGVIPFGAFLAPAAWLVFMCSYVGTARGSWHALFG